MLAEGVQGDAARASPCASGVPEMGKYRVIMAKERHFTPPLFPAPRPTRYECTNCGHILPKEAALPDTCPVCGSPKEAFVLVEED